MHSSTAIPQHRITDKPTGSPLASWTVSTSRAGITRATEYIDLRTGEIISAKDADIGPGVNVSAKLKSREAVLSKLRPEVRSFALFVLDFRNARRGITPGINTLCHWYAKVTGKRSDNVARYVPKLREADILAGENVLGKLWQFSSKRRAELSEDAAAFAKLQTVYMTGRRGPRKADATAVQVNVKGDTRPVWLQHAQSAFVGYEAYCAIRKAQGKPISMTVHEYAVHMAADDPTLGEMLADPSLTMDPSTSLTRASVAMH
ncbi:hypothetical protein [Cupriavidus plantarum]|uniref:hypothetical protein n=1 Tax=Cupriavidus plantarum TaxID=942865 RepID=UPI000E27626E|nr:hypothetical protein [Cupriavidus plantarum]REF02461.1 hypothetical protein C7418_1271 [Cupriavidus plantarum]